MRKKFFAIIVGVGLTLGTVAVFAYGGMGFKDTKGTEWFYNAAIFALNHGYMNGVKGNFMPNKPVTRDQAAVMLQKFAYNVHFEKTPRVFIDPWYGFKLTFPDSWRTSQYESSAAPVVEEYDVAMPIETHTFGAMSFNNTFETIFTIEVWRKHDWETPSGRGDTGNGDGAGAPKDNEVAAGNVVGQNNSYVVVLTPFEGAVSEELSQTYNDISKIRQSFSWVNNL